MKLKKGFMILFILLVFLSCTSVIYATDNVTNDNSVNVPDDFNSLQNEIVNKTNIVLEHDYVFDSNQSEIVINQDNFEIDGQGHTIDAKGQSRIFSVNAKNVVLKNINFINGNTTNGGALFVNKTADNLKICDCLFENNYADIAGAIDCHAKGCEIKNTVFNKNHAIGVGATSFEYSAKLINDVYTNNYATCCGALIHCGHIVLGERIRLGNSADASKGLIENCIFDNNTAKSNGVGYTCAGGLIKNSNFTNNHAKSCSVLALGSLFSSENTFQMVGCNIINNTAETEGAIVSISSSKHLTITKCNFYNNTAGMGAAICSRMGGINQIVNCNFNENHAKEGGAVYATAFGLINRCSFENNTAQKGRDIMIKQSYPVTFKISYSTFTNNAGKDSESIYSTSDVSTYGNSYEGKAFTFTDGAKLNEFKDKIEWAHYLVKGLH